MNNLEVSCTAVVCTYSDADDVYCLSLTLQVFRMCCFEKRSKYNSAKGNIFLYLRMNAKQELWLGKGLVFTV